MLYASVTYFADYAIHVLEELKVAIYIANLHTYNWHGVMYKFIDFYHTSEQTWQVLRIDYLVYSYGCNSVVD